MGSQFDIVNWDYKKGQGAHPQSGDVFKLVAIHEFLDEAKSFVVLLLLLQPITVGSRPILGKHLHKSFPQMQLKIGVNSF